MKVYVLKSSALRCVGTPPSFSTIFAKGNNFCDFLFAFPGQCSLFIIGSTLKGKNLLIGANSFLKELTPNEIEDKNEN